MSRFIPDALDDDDGGRLHLDDALARLKRLLPTRIGPQATDEVLKSLSKMREMGTSTAVMLTTVQGQLDVFSEREAIIPPWHLAMSRAIATVAPKKNAMWAFVGRAPRVLPEALVAGVADHADALSPSFGDVDFALGVAWHNVLTFHCALIAGECWSRNLATPVTDLAGAIADAGLGADDVPMLLVRDHGVLIARGHTPPSHNAPFVCREVWMHRWGHGRTQVSHVGDGSFDGVRRLLQTLGWPLDTAHLPALIAVATLPLPVGTAFVDLDDRIEGLGADEDRLEQARFRGDGSARARLGLPATATTTTLTTLRLSADGTTITLRNDGGVDVS